MHAMSDRHPIAVVFVEDDEDVAAGSAQALELAGFEVMVFGSVEAAQARRHRRSAGRGGVRRQAAGA